MGLSPLLVKQVFDIIQNINRQGTTIFMVDQNANMALSIAHRAYVLQTGQVVLSGPAGELRQNPMIREAYLGEMRLCPGVEVTAAILRCQLGNRRGVVRERRYPVSLAMRVAGPARPFSRPKPQSMPLPGTTGAPAYKRPVVQFDPRC